MKSAALIVIDMQEFFFVENRKVDKERLTSACAEIIEISRAAELPVIHVMTIYRDDLVDWPTAWRGDRTNWCGNLVRDHDLSRMVDGLIVKPDDPVVEKQRFSAFYNTNLDDILRAVGCQEIYVIGYSGDVCVRFTSVDAYNRGYAVKLVREGIESFREPTEQSIQYLGWLIDAKQVSIDEFRKMFG